jgi:Tfp pilus assembly protein PilF
LNEKYITAHLNRGIILYTRRGEFDAAITDFSAALQLGPDNVNALTHRGVAYGAKGDFRSAFADLDYAIAIAPEFDKARYYRALVHGLAGQPALALQDLDVVLRLDLANIDALTMRARVHGQLLDNDKAVRDYSAALKIAPGAAALHYNRGVSLMALKRTEEALADFSEAIRLNAGLAEAFNNRCLLRLARGDGAREAGTDCDRALRLQPSNPAFHQTSALVWMKQGDYPRASRHFDEAFTADPSRTLALYGRGFTKKQAGDSQSGERDMLAAESLDPNVRDAFGRDFIN